MVPFFKILIQKFTEKIFLYLMQKLNFEVHNMWLWIAKFFLNADSGLQCIEREN